MLLWLPFSLMECDLLSILSSYIDLFKFLWLFCLLLSEMIMCNQRKKKTSTLQWACDDLQCWYMEPCCYMVSIQRYFQSASLFFFIFTDVVAVTRERLLLQLSKKLGWLFGFALVSAWNLAEECYRYLFQCSLPFFFTVEIVLSFLFSMFLTVSSRFD